MSSLGGQWKITAKIWQNMWDKPKLLVILLSAEV